MVIEWAPFELADGVQEPDLFAASRALQSECLERHRVRVFCCWPCDADTLTSRSVIGNQALRIPHVLDVRESLRRLAARRRRRLGAARRRP